LLIVSYHAASFTAMHGTFYDNVINLFVRLVVVIVIHSNYMHVYDIYDGEHKVKKNKCYYITVH